MFTGVTAVYLADSYLCFTIEVIDCNNQTVSDYNIAISIPLVIDVRLIIHIKLVNGIAKDTKIDQHLFVRCD